MRFQVGGLEVCDKSTTGAAQRPMSLFLDQGPMKGEGGDPAVTAGGLGGGGIIGGVQRKKKRTRRASEARVKKFLGEWLGILWFFLVFLGLKKYPSSSLRSYVAMVRGLLKILRCFLVRCCR